MQPAKMKGEELRARLRYLYVPFLLLGVGVAVCYTALDWVLTIKTDDAERHLRDIRDWCCILAVHGAGAANRSDAVS